MDASSRWRSELGERFADEIDAVALVGKVGEANLLPSRAVCTCQHFQCGLIGEVAVATADALFSGPGTLAVFEQFRIVICLQQEKIGVFDQSANGWRSMAEVCRPRDFAVGVEERSIAGLEDETDWIGCVMRDRETCD